MFYPFTSKFTTFDISGHDFHASVGEGQNFDVVDDNRKVDYVTGPTGVAGTAASLAGDKHYGIHRHEQVISQVF